ncbi:MAG TPA: hypothetical protein VHE36_14375 [Sphingomicrobium sp.]|jgi:hypothetical protein|nr:hypothetical protein [Sphingomicrobium sp.]
MAYLTKIEGEDWQALEVPGSARLEPAFTALEWSVIRLARIDRLWTIRAQGVLRRFWNRLVGRANPKLANPRLEALRKMAVLSWHFGFTIPGDDLADFLSAGFTLDQYELMAGSINSALGAARIAR